MLILVCLVLSSTVIHTTLVIILSDITIKETANILEAKQAQNMLANKKMTANKNVNDRIEDKINFGFQLIN